MLTKREENILYFKMFQHDLLDVVKVEELQSELFQEVSQSVHRAPSKSNIVPCILPGSRTWMVQRQRLMLGVEALAMQGLDTATVQEIAAELQFTNRNLMNLAGNAFHGGSFLQALLCMLTKGSGVYM